MKKLLCMLLALVMLFALAACGGQTNTPDPTKAPTDAKDPATPGKTEDPTPSGEPAVLDVALTNAFSGAGAIGKENPYRFASFSQVYEALLCVVDGEYQGVLAESWKKLDDVTWEVKLFPNITDSKGNAFTADDLIWVLDMQKDNKCAVADYIDLGAGKKIDDQTVQITLNTDSEGAFYLLATRMWMCTKAS